MKKAICHIEIPGYFTAGKSYEVIHEAESWAILKDNTNMAHALVKLKGNFNFNVN